MKSRGRHSHAVTLTIQTFFRLLCTCDLTVNYLQNGEICGGAPSGACRLRAAATHLAGDLSYIHPINRCNHWRWRYIHRWTQPDQLSNLGQQARVSSTLTFLNYHQIFPIRDMHIYKLHATQVVLGRQCRLMQCPTVNSGYPRPVVVHVCCIAAGRKPQRTPPYVLPAEPALDRTGHVVHIKWGHKLWPFTATHHWRLAARGNQRVYITAACCRKSMHIDCCITSEIVRVVKNLCKQHDTLGASDHTLSLRATSLGAQVGTCSTHHVSNQ